MPDLVIDYALLHDAANQLDAIQGDIDKLNRVAFPDGYSPVPGGGTVSGDDLGPFGSPGDQLANFFWNWSGALGDGVKQMKQLSATFRGVSRVFFDADASQLAAVNTAIALAQAQQYPIDYQNYLKALDAWNKLADPNHVPYYDAQGNIQYKSVPKPQPPTKPGTTVTGPNGVTTTYTTGGDDPNNPNHGPLITSETTTYTDPKTGMTYTETTTFGPDKGWHGGPVQDTVTTIHHDGGATDTITTNVNTDGSSTSTTVTKNPDGTSSTTTQTRQDWNSPWVATSTTDTTPNADPNNVNTPSPE